MRDRVEVAVIGGGVVGCSVLYHLTKLGLRDVVLIERDELTSGSTWHAAGGFHTLNGDPNVAKLQQYTIDLYKEIEELSDQPCGLHLTGGLMLAGTDERVDFLKREHAKGRYLGMETELISVEEAYDLFPLMDPSRFKGALWNPMEGHLDPSGTTHAYAKAARANGAEIVLRNPVLGIERRPDGAWDVVTKNGTVRALHVVNAGGLWAREVGRMVGLELPVLAMEHMYILTEDMPEVALINAKTGKEVVHAIDFEGELYLRQERGGMLMGTYEQGGVPWSPRQTPWDFGHELLQPDLDRIAPSLEVGFRHFPAFERAGIRQIINGPFTFAPDGNPLVGPVRGLTNFWCACAVMAGFSQGGGVGLALASWIAHADPGFDVFGMDVARFGDFATMAYTNAKVRENYSRRFRISYPNEELPAARPLRTTPVYDAFKAQNAVFGASFGLEHALWFAPEGKEPVEAPTFRRSNAFEAVAVECAAVRNGVGLIEISNFAKYEVTGPNAEAFLSRVLAGRLPKVGKIALNPMLNDRGKLIGDFTLARLGQERFMLFGSGAAETYHLRHFERHLPGDGVRLAARNRDLFGLALAGPKARDALASVTHADLGDDAFPFMAVREIEVGLVKAIVGRLSFTGERGYEIWVRGDDLRTLLTTLGDAGAAHGLRPFGGRALNALRLEKGFGSWAREYRPIYGPTEAGLDRFVAYDRGGFVGHKAALAEREAGGELRLCPFSLDDVGVDQLADEPIWQDDRVVGWITSGAYGHSVGRTVALGYLPRRLADSQGFEVEILGERVPARREDEALHDPTGDRMRN